MGKKRKRKKGKLSNLDMMTLVISLVAIIASLITFYAQFVYNPTDVKCRVVQYIVGVEQDTLNIEVEAIIINNGRTNATIAKGILFLCHEDNWAQKKFEKSIFVDEVLRSAYNPPYLISRPNSMDNLQMKGSFNVSYAEQKFGVRSYIAGIAIDYFDANGREYSKVIKIGKATVTGPFDVSLNGEDINILQLL